jgi:hypothetical protein
VRRKTVVLACLLAGVGCASEDPHGRVSVTGTVTFEGRPLDTGVIEFLPSEPQQGVSARAMIKDGRFAVPRSQGLPPGTYRVVISSPEPNPTAGPAGPPGMKMPPPGRERIPARYNRESRETVVVRSDAANRFDFTID